MHQAGAAVLSERLPLPTPAAGRRTVACACGHPAQYRELRSDLTSKGTVRIVENLTFMPVTKEGVEEPTLVETFQAPLDDGLYKIWPKEALEPGEYAVIQYSEGKLNIQTWDFAVQAAK
jgi:hypothetical protein